MMRLRITKTPEFTIQKLVFTLASSLYEERPEEFAVYPNPAVNQVIITGIQGPAIVHIFNGCGILVQTARLNGFETSVPLDLPEEGLYYLKCTTGSDTFCKPIVKMNSL